MSIDKTNFSSLADIVQKYIPDSFFIVGEEDVILILKECISGIKPELSAPSLGHNKLFSEHFDRVIALASLIAAVVAAFDESYSMFQHQSPDIIEIHLNRIHDRCVADLRTTVVSLGESQNIIKETLEFCKLHQGKRK